MGLNINAYSKWFWAGRYLAVIALSFILALALSHMDLFLKTTIGKKLNAAHLVQFLGYGVSLTMLWLLGRQATIVLQKQGGKLLMLQHYILPVVSLLVMALAYSVVLLVLKPFMGVMLANTLNWVFIVAILACSGWLVMAVLNQSAPLTALLTRNRK